jgi:hypothetical protein
MVVDATRTAAAYGAASMRAEYGPVGPVVSVARSAARSAWPRPMTT